MTQWIIPVCAAILLMATCTMHRVARADNNPFSGARSFEITMKREATLGNGQLINRPKRNVVYRPEKVKR